MATLQQAVDQLSAATQAITDLTALYANKEQALDAYALGAINAAQVGALAQIEALGSAQRLTLYVDAVAGNDTNSGTSDLPLQSIAAAAALGRPGGSLVINLKTDQTHIVDPNPGEPLNRSAGTTGGQLNFPSSSFVHIKAWGTGDKPILKNVRLLGTSGSSNYMTETRFGGEGVFVFGSNLEVRTASAAEAAAHPDFDDHSLNSFNGMFGKSYKSTFQVVLENSSVRVVDGILCHQAVQSGPLVLALSFNNDVDWDTAASSASAPPALLKINQVGTFILSNTSIGAGYTNNGFGVADCVEGALVDSNGSLANLITNVAGIYQ